MARNLGVPPNCFESIITPNRVSNHIPPPLFVLLFLQKEHHETVLILIKADPSAAVKPILCIWRDRFTQMTSIQGLLHLTSPLCHVVEVKGKKKKTRTLSKHGRDPQVENPWCIIKPINPTAFSC